MAEQLSDEEIEARVKRAMLRSQQPKHPGGRPTLYTEELVDEICIRIAGGRSILSVAADDDMPTQSTIYLWRELHPEFSEKIARARDDRQEAYAHQMVELGQRAVNDEIDPQRINAAVNAIDKAARLQQPKTRVELSGPNGAPVQTSSSDTRDLAKAVALLMAKGLRAQSE